MKSVFLAHAFRDEDRDLVSVVERLLASHGVTVVNGLRLAGEAITSEVKRRIDSAEGLVALLTRCDALQNGRFRPRSWVEYELNHARDRSKPSIALVENLVDTGTVYGERETIPYEPTEPQEALLRLSETVAEWRRQFGRLMTVRILPEAVAKKLGRESQVRYCLIRDGQYSDWRQAQLVPEPGGTFLYVSGIHEDTRIQVEIQDGRTRWLSVATPPWMSVELSKKAGRA